MSSNVTVAVDLAKNVFQLAVSNPAGRITEHRRFRPQFERFWQDRLPCRVVIQACASAHFWARKLTGLGFEVVLLPPHYVRPYVRRNKTDRTDCEALLEAEFCREELPLRRKQIGHRVVEAYGASAVTSSEDGRTRCSVRSRSRSSITSDCSSFLSTSGYSLCNASVNSSSDRRAGGRDSQTRAPTGFSPKYTSSSE